MSWEAWGDDDDGCDHAREAYARQLLEDGWADEQQVTAFRDAVSRLMAEPIYAGGKKENGVSLRFLARITLLRVAAGLLRADEILALEAAAMFRDA